jgi:pimeloyl-ACP methyl ester carboxylesterase
VRALGLADVDVYGDSYGSWFAQVFAARYPSPVRSVVLDAAVSCLDYPQPFPLVSSISARRADLKAAENALPADTFAPFTIAQWLAMDQNTETYTSCLQWPTPQVAQPPVATKPPFLPASVPVLILGGSA